MEDAGTLTVMRMKISSILYETYNSTLQYVNERFQEKCSRIDTKIMKITYVFTELETRTSPNPIDWWV